MDGNKLTFWQEFWLEMLRCFVGYMNNEVKRIDAEKEEKKQRG